MNNNKKWKTTNHVFTIFGFVVTISVIILSLFEDVIGPFWIRVILFIIAVATLLWLLRRKFNKLYESSHHLLLHLVPWFIICLLAINLIIFFIIRPSKQDRQIIFDKRMGAIFNSWQYNPIQRKYIYAWGSGPGDLMWIIDKYGTASFSYHIDSKVMVIDSSASSGGYMTFYGNPCERSNFREISFKCRAFFKSGRPDLGLRLVVDDPKELDDKELVTYEISSLRKYYRGKQEFDETWQTFSIDINDFKRKRYEPPFPKWIDENTINKIVFFVNTKTVKNCSEAQFSLRDVYFKATTF